MRAVYTVEVRRHSLGLKDLHGNAREGWSDPEPLKVYGWSPNGSQEPGTDRADVTTGLVLYLPAEAVLGPHDRVLVEGDEYEVEGRVADFGFGPFGFRPGKTVTLSRTEG